jgi:hypothetical protein
MATERFAIRWPKFLKRGGILPDGSLYCYSWGLNCASFEFGGGLQVFSAPGKRSKLHDPELTELAGKLNALLAGLARSKGRTKRMLRMVVLDEQLCLTLGDARPELDKASADDLRKFVRQGTDFDLMSPAEIQKALDL